MERQVAASSPAAAAVGLIVFDENEARSRRTRLLAFACCCLSVGLVAVGLLSPFWLEAEGFHQGLWRYCTWTTATQASSSSSTSSDDATAVCFDNVDSAWMFICRVLCCLTFVSNLLIVFVLATNLLPTRGRPTSSSSTPPPPLLPLCRTIGCWDAAGRCPTNAIVVCLLVASIMMISVVVVLFPAMFNREKDLYRLRFNRSQWFFSWTYGITCGSIPFLLTSVGFITYDYSLSSSSASATDALASRQTSPIKPTPSSQPLTYKETGKQFHLSV